MSNYLKLFERVRSSKNILRHSAEMYSLTDFNLKEVGFAVRRDAAQQPGGRQARGGGERGMDFIQR